MIARRHLVLGTLAVLAAPQAALAHKCLTEDEARRYGVGVGVGKAGLTFRGRAIVERKAKWPFWRPTANMIRRHPRKYRRYARGVRGGPKNPLGARALYLHRGGRDTMYRIHGINQPASIGRSVSNGCIRMLNAM